MNNVRLQEIDSRVVIDVVKDGEWIEVTVDSDNPKYKDLVKVSEVTKGKHRCKTHPKDKCGCRGCSL